MNRHEQLIHIDMNWNDEQTPEEMDARNADAKRKAETIAKLIRDPSKGVHTEAFETLCGWAVQVVHNALTIGEADLKREAVEVGYQWHRNTVDEHRARELLLVSGRHSPDEVDRLIERAGGMGSGKPSSLLPTIKDPGRGRMLEIES